MRLGSGTSVPGAPQRPSVRSQQEWVEPDHANTVHGSGSEALEAISAHMAWHSSADAARPAARTHLHDWPALQTSPITAL